MTGKPRLFVLSHVLPLPRISGQQQRVFYILQSARAFFHVTFVALAENGEAEAIREKLSALCDEVILLPVRYAHSQAAKVWHKSVGSLYAVRTGLKLSNYIVGQLEFAPSRIASLLLSNHFDCALFEYWHAFASTRVFHEKGIPCVLDMHNILWQDYARDMRTRMTIMPLWWKHWALGKYRTQEESAWNRFDGLVAINREEYKYVQANVPITTKLFHAPMGTDLTFWPYSWKPAQPPRLAYYGGLASHHNQQGALRCFNHIMPEIWCKFPEAEFWLVGSNPPESLRALASDPRIKVTGYVENVQPILQTMSAVLCPFTGTYGFRSRLIEVMALGVPVVATPDAVYGMDLEDGKGLWLGQNDGELARQALRLLDDHAFACEQSRLARKQVEQLFSIENTYGRLMQELSEWLEVRREKKI